MNGPSEAQAYANGVEDERKRQERAIPTNIADLIMRLRALDHDGPNSLFPTAAHALAAQAREIEQLKSEKGKRK